jgi:hypothetical protein
MITKYIKLNFIPKKNINEDCWSEVNKHLPLKDKLALEQTCKNINKGVKDDNIKYWLKIMCALRSLPDTKDQLDFKQPYGVLYKNVYVLLKNEGYLGDWKYKSACVILNADDESEVEDTGFRESLYLIGRIYDMFTKCNKPEIIRFDILRLIYKWRNGVSTTSYLYGFRHRTEYRTRYIETNIDMVVKNPYSKIKAEMKKEANPGLKRLKEERARRAERDAELEEIEEREYQYL